MHPGERILLRQLRVEIDREHFEERAAIFEFEAGLQRTEAERLARQAVRERPLPIGTDGSDGAAGAFGFFRELG